MEEQYFVFDVLNKIINNEKIEYDKIKDNLCSFR